MRDMSAAVRARALIVAAILAAPAIVLAQGARGPYHDRAEQESALKRLPPDEELRVRAWAAEHPEAIRRRGGATSRNAQDSMSQELDKELKKLSPEQRKDLEDLGGDIEVPEKK